MSAKAKKTNNSQAIPCKVSMTVRYSSRSQRSFVSSMIFASLSSREGVTYLSSA